jgi:hypothetical protein
MKNDGKDIFMSANLNTFAVWMIWYWWFLLSFCPTVLVSERKVWITA